MSNSLNQPQPVPTPNARRPTWEAVIERVRNMRSRIEGEAPVHEAVLIDMGERDEFGRRKYGTPLQPFNGRDSLVDLYQELLDCCVYSANHQVECAPSGFAGFLVVSGLHDDLIRMTLRVKRLILEREQGEGAGHAD
jgi:hypothetical protein